MHGAGASPAIQSGGAAAALHRARSTRSTTAFTLVELLVAMGLMAILLTMIAQIFFQASQSFRLARASVESHRSARAALDVMLRDFAAARLVNHGSYTPAARGRFRYQLVEDPVSASAGVAPPLPYVPSIMFTTTAGQSGVRSLYPNQESQVALVQYTLEWTGMQTKLPDEITGLPGPEQPVYTLMKKVRLPTLTNDYLDMSDAGKWAVTPSPKDITSEPLAFNVLALSVRVFRSNPSGSAPVWRSLPLAEDPLPDEGPPPNPADYEPPDLGVYPYDTMTAPRDYDPLPYMIEITLKMADKHIVKVNTFTERFYLPASAE